MEHAVESCKHGLLHAWTSRTIVIAFSQDRLGVARAANLFSANNGDSPGVERDTHYDCGAAIEITSSPLHFLYVRHLSWGVENNHTFCCSIPSESKKQTCAHRADRVASHANGTSNTVPLTTRHKSEKSDILRDLAILAPASGR
jgi:hypothetical protein